MEIWINGETHTVEEPLTVQGLLAALSVPEALVVVERNRVIVPRNAFTTEPVEPGDRFELVRLIGGG